VSTDVVYGRNPVLALIRSGGRRANEIAVLTGATGPLAEVVALARRAGIADQPHRLTRGAQPELHFWTHRNPFHVGAKDLDQEGVAFMPPVVPDELAQQALADSDAKGRGHLRYRAAAALGVSSAAHHVGLDLSGWR
jgi:hypothetical protein